MPAMRMEQSKKKFLKNMVGFSIMTWVSFVLGFISSPIATRLFDTAEKGQLDVFLTYTSLFSAVCYLGLDQAFVRFYNEPPSGSSRKGMFTFCVAVPLGFNVLCALFMSFFWKQLSGQVTGGAPDGLIFSCMAVYSFFMVVYRFLSLSYRMEQNARMYTIQGVIYAFITKLSYLAVGFGDAKGRSAILLLTSLVCLYSVVFIFLQRNRFDVRGLRAVDEPFCKTMGKFALPLVPLSLLSTLNSSVSVLALNQLLGLSATGIFTSALGLASTINIIQTGFNTYWAPYVFENYKLDGGKRFFVVHRLMACLLTFFGLLITLLQTPVFLLLGSNYRSSVVFFPFLFLSPICYCLGETTGMGINISQKTWWTTLIFLFSSLINIGLCYLLIPLMGMAGAALASAFAGILTLILRTVVGDHYYKVLGDYRCLAATILLMLAASFGNLWLTGVAKYAVLVAVIAAAFAVFRPEVAMLWRTAMQLLQGLRRRKKGAEPHA